MATFPTPSQIQAQYKQILQAIKPTLNVNDPNSDFIIRGNAQSGIVSGLYGDQAKVNNDTWISTARPTALTQFGVDYAVPQQPATAATGPQNRITGVNGTVVNPGDLTFLYLPTQVLYQNTSGGIISGGILDVANQCEVTGSIGNVAAPDTLQLVSPPAGVNSTAAVMQNIANGSDIESTDSYRQRLLVRRQNQPAGGNQTDYPAFAFAADPTVRTALIRRFGRGLGTVDIYITTGTTDIDNAVTNGLPIVRIPSGPIITEVQNYYNANVPLCDCPVVYAPVELPVDVNVNYLLAPGLSPTAIPSDPIYNPLGLTCAELITREVKRALYKIPVGGRITTVGNPGVVAASDIEQDLDNWLSSEIDLETGLAIGKLPIMSDRKVQNLDGSNVNLVISANQLPAPGTITPTLGGGGI